MSVKEAMNFFFARLEEKSNELTDRKPVCTYNEKGSNLYLSEPDEFGKVEWMPKNAEPIVNNTLPHDLYEFYSAFYYAEFSGRVKKNHFFFTPVYNLKEAEKAARYSVKIGKHYFPKEDIYHIGMATNENNETAMLCLNGADNMLFLYDDENDERTPLRLNLETFFYKLKPLE